MTKAELEEYVEELEDVIDQALDAFEDDDPDEAEKVLAEYGEEDEPGEESEQKPELAARATK